MKTIRQSEAAECGLACIAMILNVNAHPMQLTHLRQRFPQSLKGVNLNQLIDIADSCHLHSRPLKLSFSEMAQLQLPCVLHWDLNHFVVLEKIKNNSYHIHDPANGLLEMKAEQVAEHFTGVALELAPTDSFNQQESTPLLTFSDISPSFKGLARSLWHIFFISVMLQIFVLVTPFYMQLIIDDVVISSDVDLLLVLGVAFGGLVIFQQAFSWLRGAMIIHLGAQLHRQFSEKLFCHLLNLPNTFFSSRHVADIVSRFQSIEPIKQLVANKAVEAIIDGGMAIVTLVVIFIYQQTLGLIVVLSVLLYLLIRLIWYRSFKQTNEKLIRATADEQAHFMESIRNIQSIKLMSLGNQRITDWLNRFVKSINQRVKLEHLTLNFQLLNGFLFGIANVMIIYLGANLVIDADANNLFTLGMLIAFVSYKNLATSRLSGLVDTYVEIKMLSLHMQRISDIALTPAAPRDKQIQTLEQHTTLSSSPILTANNLSFTYPQDKTPLFSNIKIEVNAGEKVAIVGQSGIGKSTLLQTLNRLLPANEGVVCIASKDILNIQSKSLRQFSATIMQNDTLLTGTIAENIANFKSPIDLEKVTECAQLACINNDIENMPMQLNTFIGEMGSALSGGQIQRILLARALYKSPKLLFLDEATSHLDSSTERQVIANFNQLNIAQIIIAHRHETIVNADRVLKLTPNGLEDVTENYRNTKSNTQ